MAGPAIPMPAGPVAAPPPPTVAPSGVRPSIGLQYLESMARGGTPGVQAAPPLPGGAGGAVPPMPPGAPPGAAGAVPGGGGPFAGMGQIAGATRGQRLANFARRPMTGPLGHTSGRPLLPGGRAGLMRGAGAGLGYFTLGNMLEQQGGAVGDAGSSVKWLGPAGALTAGALGGSTLAGGAVGAAGGILGEAAVNMAPDWTFGHIGDRAIGWGGDRSMANVFENIGSFFGIGGGGDEKKQQDFSFQSLNKAFDVGGISQEARGQLEQEYNLAVEVAKAGGVWNDETKMALHQDMLTRIPGLMEQEQAQQQAMQNMIAQQALVSEYFGGEGGIMDRMRQAGQARGDSMAALAGQLPGHLQPAANFMATDATAGANSLAAAYEAQIRLLPQMNAMTQYQQELSGIASQVLNTSIQDTLSGGASANPLADPSALLAQQYQ